MGTQVFGIFGEKATEKIRKKPSREDVVGP